MNDDAPTTSNAATPGSDAASGYIGLPAKLCATLLFADAITYGASTGKKTPASSVDDVGSTLLLAPSTACSSNRLSPDSTLPSMS